MQPMQLRLWRKQCDRTAFLKVFCQLSNGWRLLVVVKGALLLGLEMVSLERWYPAAGTISNCTVTALKYAIGMELALKGY